MIRKYCRLLRTNFTFFSEQTKISKARRAMSQSPRYCCSTTRTGSWFEGGLLRSMSRPHSGFSVVASTWIQSILYSPTRHGSRSSMVRRIRGGKSSPPSITRSRAIPFNRQSFFLLPQDYCRRAGSEKGRNSTKRLEFTLKCLIFPTQARNKLLDQSNRMNESRQRVWVNLTVM
jgi:hypothetical protein